MLPRRASRKQPEPLATFVVFRAAGRRFALPTGHVLAVAEAPGVTPLPAPGRPEVLGLVGHRGRALALVDLGGCLGVAGRPASSAAPGPFCVVVGHGGRRAAFPVDELEGLVRIAGSGLPPGCETFDPAGAIFGAGEEEAP